MTTRKERHLANAKRKVRHFHERRYCGCFIPMEVISLVDIGGIYNYDQQTYDYALKLKANGESGRMWFYFELGKLTLE